MVQTTSTKIAKTRFDKVHICAKSGKVFLLDFFCNNVSFNLNLFLYFVLEFSCILRTLKLVRIMKWIKMSCKLINQNLVGCCLALFVLVRGRLNIRCAIHPTEISLEKEGRAKEQQDLESIGIEFVPNELNRGWI